MVSLTHHLCHHGVADPEIFQTQVFSPSEAEAVPEVLGANMSPSWVRACSQHPLLLSIWLECRQEMGLWLSKVASSLGGWE